MQELLADMYKNATDEDRAGLRDAMRHPKMLSCSCPEAASQLFMSCDGD